MRKTSYPSKLEPRLARAIEHLGLMTHEELMESRRSWQRRKQAFQWPEFLAAGRGALSLPWTPPDVPGLVDWLTERSRHYGHPVSAELGGTDEQGSVRFTTAGGNTAEASWRRAARAYAGVENAIVELWAQDRIPLCLEKLEPRGEEFEWIIIRADQFEEFEEHIKGEREWHSQLSRSYQRFCEAAESEDEEARLAAAVVGVRAGEMMRGLGADYTFHTHHVQEMYSSLGKESESARWSRYPRREHPRGM